MINIDDFTKRLQKIIDFYGENASSFAEKIGVQRSSISHILSGRNKPSLDFILKLLSAYPDVELYWLLNGKGHFPADSNNLEATFREQETIPDKAATYSSNVDIPVQNTDKAFSEQDKSIERIVIFYSDGTFKSFKN